MAYGIQSTKITQSMLIAPPSVGDFMEGKAAITGNWQPPADAPAQYRLLLSLQLDQAGPAARADLLQPSGDARLDSALLAAARQANLPAPQPNPPPHLIQLCMAMPDNACAAGESRQQTGSSLVINGYAPDSVTLNYPPPRHPGYYMRVQQIISSNVRYPHDALLHGNEGVVVVRLRIQRDGTISNVNVVQAATFPALNAEAIHVFDRIGRLPPIPAETSPEIAEFVIELPITFAMH